jgi:hypothetical protein
MPSNLGAVVEKAQYELLDWAGWLGLLKPGQHSLLTNGIVLRMLVAEEDVLAFSRFNPECNPFAIHAERPYLLWLLLELDGGLLRHFVPALTEEFRQREFSRVDAVRQYRDALVNLRKQTVESRMRVPLDENARLFKTISKLDEELSRPDTSNERELFGIMRISPRLENLVDLGFLTNASRDPETGLRLSYVYEINDGTRRLSEFLRSSGESDFDRYVQTKFFGFLVSRDGRGNVRISDPDAILPYFVKAYSRFQRELGAKPMLPLCIAAAALALDEGKYFFEVSDAVDALLTLKDKMGNQIRLSGGHTGGQPEFVVLDRHLLGSVSDARNRLP